MILVYSPNNDPPYHKSIPGECMMKNDIRYYETK